jgi:hypothetical protein
VRTPSLLATACLLFAATTSAQAAEYCVGTTNEFQAALLSAQSQPGFDLIKVKPGLYTGTPLVQGRALFDFDGVDGLSIRGVKATQAGECIATHAAPGEVVLSGSMLHPVMSLRNAGGVNAVTVANLRIVDGLANANRAGGLSLQVAPGLTSGIAFGFRLVLETNRSFEFFAPAAVSLDARAGEVQVFNSLLRNNTTTGAVIATLRSFGGTAVFNNNTVVGNQVEMTGRGALHATGTGTVYAANNVLWNNLASGTTALDLTADSVTALLNNNHIQGTNSVAGGSTGNFLSTAGDPLFLGVDDFRLQGQSPARNSGTLQATSVNTMELALDLSGRVLGGAIDRGAYEFPDVFRNGFE